jgi:ribosomal protein L19
MDAVKKPFRLISHDRRVQYGVGVESVAEVICKSIDQIIQCHGNEVLKQKQLYAL